MGGPIKSDKPTDLVPVLHSDTQVLHFAARAGVSKTLVRDSRVCINTQGARQVDKPLENLERCWSFLVHIKTNEPHYQLDIKLSIY